MPHIHAHIHQQETQVDTEGAALLKREKILQLLIGFPEMMWVGCRLGYVTPREFMEIH